MTEIIKVDFWRENSNIYLWKIEKIVVARKCCKMRLLWQSKLYFQIMGQEDVKVRRCSNKLSSSKATFISSLRRETEAIIARCYTTPCSTKAPEENKNREENAYWKKKVLWQCWKITTKSLMKKFLFWQQRNERKLLWHEFIGDFQKTTFASIIWIKCFSTMIISVKTWTIW